MTKYIPWILAIITLSACSSPKETATTTDEPKAHDMCIAGFVEDAPGVGTIDIFFPAKHSPDVQSISEVSVKVAKELTDELGVC